MKHNFFIILCLFMILPGCDKKLEEINIDPTKLTPQNMQFNYLFTSAEIYAAGAGTLGSSFMYSSTMMQQLSSTSIYFPGDKYIYDEGRNGDFWLSQYSSSIKSIADVIENIKQDEKRQNLYNISRILKAFLFQRMTDLYGDIPYSEAGLGFISSSTSPKYDLQKDIYAHLLTELEDAARKLDATADNTVDVADLFYGGDVANWKKFAYSEMLRLAMRMSKAAPDSAEKWSEKAVQGGVMESNLDNAICPHNAKGLYNPVSNLVGIASSYFADYRLSETFINFLKNNDDPRLPYLATVAENPADNTDLGNNDPAIQLGQPNGYDNSGGAEDITNAPNWPGDQNKYSVINRTTFARGDAPTFILTYAETALLLSEAAQRGWNVGGTAPDYYNKGVKAAILQLNRANANISEDEADDYLNAHPYVPANGLEMINRQYWIATFADWNETWCNWRRSGYPQLTEVNYHGTTTIGSIPRRFTYPLNEASVNPQNYKEAVARIPGGDKMTSRVWWDVP